MNPNIETLARETADQIYVGDSGNTAENIAPIILAALRAAVEPLEAQCAAMRQALELWRGFPHSIQYHCSACHKHGQGAVDLTESALGTDAGSQLLMELASLRETVKKLEAERRRDALDGQGALDEANNTIARLLAELAELRQSRKWPDIGPDPLKDRDKVDNSEDGSRSRLIVPVCLQQPEVPNQTALVWRIDISRVSDELIWRRAAMESLKKQNDELRDRLAKAEAVWGNCKIVYWPYDPEGTAYPLEHYQPVGKHMREQIEAALERKAQ